MFVSKEFHIKTIRDLQIIDLTQEVEKFLAEHQCMNGFVNVFTKHTTATIKINELENGLAKDMELWCDKYVPTDEFYHHNDLPNRDPSTMYHDREESLDGHSHLRYLLMWATSETIPVVDGKMQLGRWQSILFIEMDRAKERTVVFSFTGA